MEQEADKRTGFHKCYSIDQQYTNKGVNKMII